MKLTVVDEQEQQYKIHAIALTVEINRPEQIDYRISRPEPYGPISHELKYRFLPEFIEQPLPSHKSGWGTPSIEYEYKKNPEENESNLDIWPEHVRRMREFVKENPEVLEILRDKYSKKSDLWNNDPIDEGNVYRISKFGEVFKDFL